jgi:hypothetical protein
VRYLEVRVPSENPDFPEPLVIQTFDLEVRMTWFHPWHIHCEHSKNRPAEEYMDHALAWIGHVVSDEFAVAVEYRDGEARSASGYHHSRVPAWVASPEPGATIIVRSWRGTHDGEIAGPPTAS